MKLTPQQLGTLGSIADNNGDGVDYRLTKAKGKGKTGNVYLKMSYKRQATHEEIAGAEAHSPGADLIHIEVSNVFAIHPDGRVVRL